MEQVHSGICELGQLARPQLLFHAVYHQLTHCGLVTPYGDIDLGQHWLR